MKRMFFFDAEFIISKIFLRALIMKKKLNKEYVSISARIPKEIYIKMSLIRDSLDMTTNQIVSHCIDDWVDLAVSPHKTTTHRISVARYALKITEDESE